MTRYILSRLLKSLPVVLVSSFIVFLLLKLVPGDPAQIRAGIDASPEQIESVRVQLGLSGTLFEQFVRWLELAVTGDLGQSFISRSPVGGLILQRLPATLELAALAIFLVATLGTLLGVTAAVNARTRVDASITVASALMISIPDYWLATIGILFFAVWLGVLPPGGYVSTLENPSLALHHLILPILALITRPTAVIARFARAAVLDVSRNEFVWTARSKGLPEWRVILLHIVPNALVPVITILAVQFGQMLGSTVVIEALFGWPGLGGLLVNSIRARDYTVIQGAMLLLVISFIVINLVADLLYAWLDPRIRIGSPG